MSARKTSRLWTVVAVLAALFALLAVGCTEQPQVPQQPAPQHVGMAATQLPANY
jgi:hypothetical protein